MKRFTTLLALFVLVGFQLLQAQSVQITGIVTSSEDGIGLPGVSVVVKGTTIGTVTDYEGNYTLSVPQDAPTLTFSFIGMVTQEHGIAGMTLINVVLDPDIVGIDEVVVTALGITREKKSLGYSVQTVSGEKISQASNPNFASALSGKVAGLEVRQSSGMPGAPSTILIRGARSFSGNNQPLYVVDGMPISSNNDYSQNVTGAYNTTRSIDIDPNDIESINVLKGQAAAALYGLRASNGVIIITTKSGKGAQSGTPVIDIGFNYTMDKISLLPDRQTTYSQGNGGSFAAANSFSWGELITDLPNNATYGGNSRGQAGMFFDPYQNKYVAPQAFNNPEDFFQNGGTYNTSVSISQANESSNYVIGLSSTNQDGIVPTTGMNRYTGKIGANFNIGDKWDAGFTGNYSDVSLQKLPSGNDSWLFTLYGSPPTFDLMNTPYHQEGTLGDFRQISYRRGAVGQNPRWAVENNKYLEATKRFFGNAHMVYTPASWIRIKYQMGIDTYSTGNENIQQAGDGDLPAASQYPTPDNPVYAFVQPTGGSVDNYGITRSTLNSLLNVTLTKTFGNINTALHLGNEINDMQRRNWTTTGLNFNEIGWTNIGNTLNQYAGESKAHERTVGFFGNLSLDYNSLIYVNLTGRNDIVSTMPRGSRSFFYPSASVGFVFTELPGLKGNTTLPFGKVRVSYAQVGQAGSYYDITYEEGGATSGFLDTGILYPFAGVTGYKPSSTIYDPDLIPQNTSSMEFGFDLKFINNRIGIEYTYLDQTAKDQIFGVPMAGSTGYSTFVTNAGKMTSKGHEVVMNFVPVRTALLTWNISLNFTKIENKCVELAKDVENIFLGGYVEPNIRASEGDTYPAIYGNMYERDDAGNILVEEDPASTYYGMPVAGDFGKIGEVSPDFILGGFTSLNIKWVTIGASFEWKKGGQMYSGSNRLMDLYGTSARTENRTDPIDFIEDMVKADGTPSDIVRGGTGDEGAYYDYWADNRDAISESQIYETSFFKIRDLSLTIDLPQSVTAPVKIKKLSISFIARNIMLGSTLPYFDPEASQGMGNMQGGMDYMSLPQTTSYGAGIKLTF